MSFTTFPKGGRLPKADGGIFRAIQPFQFHHTLGRALNQRASKVKSNSHIPADEKSPLNPPLEKGGIAHSALPRLNLISIFLPTKNPPLSAQAGSPPPWKRGGTARFNFYTFNHTASRFIIIYT